MSIRIIWQLVSLHSEFEKMKRKSIWRPQLCRVWILVQCGHTGHCLDSPSTPSAHWALRWKMLPHQEPETSEIFRIYVVEWQIPGETLWRCDDVTVVAGVPHWAPGTNHPHVIICTLPPPTPQCISDHLVIQTKLTEDYIYLQNYPIYYLFTSTFCYDLSLHECILCKVK